MGQCKQLLPLGGTTVIGRCLGALVAGGTGTLTVVVSEAENGVAAAARDYPVTIVVNSEGEGDMSSSVRAGRAALPADVSGVIVCPGDYPLVSAATIAALIAAHAASPDRIIIPCHRGRRGHPLLFPRPVLEELTGGLILRDLVRRDPGRISCIDTDDPGILHDMDTPEDYERICTLIEQSDTTLTAKGAAP